VTYYSDGEIKRIQSKRRAKWVKDHAPRSLVKPIKDDPLDKKEKLPEASQVKTGRALCRKVAKEMGVRCVR